MIVLWIIRPSARGANSSMGYLGRLPERLAAAFLAGAQACAGIFVGIGSYDLPKVDAVEISAGIEFLAHRLHQRRGRQIITMQRPALVVHNTLPDNG